MTEIDTIVRGAFVRALASAVTPADVRRGDTALTLMRSGWPSKTIREFIDEVEAHVLRPAKVPA